MEEIRVVIGHTAWNDIQLINNALTGTEIRIIELSSTGTMMADAARVHGADCVLFSPTIPDMTPQIVQELLLHEDKPIAAVGLIPAGTNYAAEYQRFGMKGFVTTPLDVSQARRLPDIIRHAVQVAREERASRTFTPITPQEAMQILDRGGWQQATIAVYSPKGGVGKTTVAVNLACALAHLGGQNTLLIDADLSRANAHCLLGLDIEEEPRNLFSLYERVIAMANRTGKLMVPYQTLQANVVTISPKLHFLPGVPKMHLAGSPEFLEDPDRTINIFDDLLKTARGYYTFRVIDTGLDFNHPVHWAVLNYADKVLIIVTPERTAIEAVKDILPALERAFGSLNRFFLILNGFSPEFGIDPKEVTRYLDGKCPILAKLPHSPNEVRLSINRGSPYVLEKTLTPLGEETVRLASIFYPPLEAVLRRKAKAPGNGLMKKVRNILAS
jgi:pilus assembly protein CpaE